MSPASTAMRRAATRPPGSSRMPTRTRTRRAAGSSSPIPTSIRTGTAGRTDRRTNGSQPPPPQAAAHSLPYAAAGPPEVLGRAFACGAVFPASRHLTVLPHAALPLHHSAALVPPPRLPPALVYIFALFWDNLRNRAYQGHTKPHRGRHQPSETIRATQARGRPR